MAPDALHDFSGKVGKILYCVHCHAFGKAVPTHCPAKKMSIRTTTYLQQGVINYKNGLWYATKTGRTLGQYDPTR